MNSVIFGSKNKRRSFALRVSSLVASGLVFCGVTLGSVQWAAAAPIPVVNPGFEADVLGDGVSTFGFAAGWTIIGAGIAGPFNPAVGHYPGQAPEGSNIAFANNSEIISQTLAETLALNTTYTLQVEVGRRLDLGSSPVNYAVELRGGASVLASESLLSPALGQFLTSTVVFTSGATEPEFGQALGIRLIHAGGGNVQVNFDDVRLNAQPVAVPEPSTAMLTALGSLSLFFYRWRRRRSLQVGELGTSS